MDNKFTVATLNGCTINGGTLAYQSRPRMVVSTEIGDYQIGDILDANAVMYSINKTVDQKMQNIARRFVKTIAGDGEQTKFIVTHNLNTKLIMVDVYNTGDFETPVDFQYSYVNENKDNAINIEFAEAPANGVEYAVMVIG